ncbi:FG-GAP-like repeat-containing protein [Streptomyces krungchingensis]|uniref:FG-GAP-like repeat-containing protein n=1 Tax=Streptomyces sp. Tue6028 TaxID=2036037 RepID=UPI003D7229AA
MRIRTSAALAALLAAGLTPLTLTTPASAAPAKYADDFNGDGYRDLVTGAPYATVGGAAYAGAVVVNYGSASGISASRRTVVTQNTSGIPGTAEKNDEFGTSLASGDLNNDGYADLVVGAAREDVGSDVDGGTAVIVWGGKNGLSGGLTVSDPAPSSHDRYGRTLAVGDFSGDGRADLAVAGDGKDVAIHKGGFTKASGPASRYQVVTGLQSGPIGGPHSMAAGDLNGDGTDDLVLSGSYYPDPETIFEGTLVYRGSSAGLTFERAIDNDNWDSTAVGDLNGDGYDDLVASAEPDDVRPGDGGSISTYLGGPDGLGSSPRQTIDQDTPGVPGAAEDSDWFGSALSIDDIDGDGRGDLAVSALYEDIGSAVLAGSVTVFRGAASGLSTTGVKSFTQNTEGVPGTAEKTDQFGKAVRLADLNGDHRADLAIGADGENDADGGLWVLRGSSSGITTKNALSFGPSSVGVPTTGYPRFGFALLR